MANARQLQSRTADEESALKRRSFGGSQGPRSGRAAENAPSPEPRAHHGPPEQHWYHTRLAANSSSRCLSFPCLPLTLGRTKNCTAWEPCVNGIIQSSRYHIYMYMYIYIYVCMYVYCMYNNVLIRRLCFNLKPHVHHTLQFIACVPTYWNDML